MQITIDTNNMSELDRAMLGYLAAQDVEEVEPEPVKPAKAAATKKAAAPKAGPEPEPETEEEDLLGGPSLSDAIAAATNMVSDGKANQVKAALAEVGAKRVSDLKAEDVATFLTALEVEE